MPLGEPADQGTHFVAAVEQAGELALTMGDKGRFRPVLLTSRNIDRFDIERVSVEGILPAPIEYVTYAVARQG